MQINILPIIFTILTFVSTLGGGLFGLKYKDKLHLILGFTAGVLLGVVAFDIFPEIISLINELQMESVSTMVALVVGFLLFHIFEKMLLIHHEQDEFYAEHKHPAVGVASALALAGHSFMDGVGIGLGFQVAPQIGILVAIAVIAHDFSDGLNTVSLALVHHNHSRRALTLLIIDALAPVLGVLSTLLFSVPDKFLVLYLGFFAGFLLYIGAADILPEAHSKKSSFRTILMTILGSSFIFVVSRLV
ncbi:ZIP family metal transporter [Patescibacteria group bacterium]|nr:ZIP family metal transporter [Patescibacteria group bacterium]MCL5409797.1 ZIP family metal transporter [Patescibacteria group bacterium]